MIFPFQVDAHAHGADVGLPLITFSVPDMSRPVPCRHQNLHFLPEKFFP